MKPVDQTQFAGEGVGGNCVQASVASILGLPLIDVPHFLEIADRPEEWELAFMDWLEDRGVGYIRRGGDWVFDGFPLDPSSIKLKVPPHVAAILGCLR